MPDVYVTKEELRLLLRLVRGEYVQRTDKSERLRAGIAAKIVLSLPPEAPTAPPEDDTNAK